MAGQPSTQTDIRSSFESVDVINNPWQALHSNIKQIFLQKMLAERKHISDFEQFLKEIDFSNIFEDLLETFLNTSQSHLDFSAKEL